MRSVPTKLSWLGIGHGFIPIDSRFGALAKQFWSAVRLSELGTDNCPKVVTADSLKALDLDRVDKEDRERVRKLVERMATGRPFLEESDNPYVKYDAYNISISRCFNCDDISVWIYDQLLWPRRDGGPQPNPDLSDEVRRDYEGGKYDTRCLPARCSRPPPFGDTETLQGARRDRQKH